MNFTTIESTIPVDQVLRILEAQLEILKALTNPPMIVEDEEARP